MNLKLRFIVIETYLAKDQKSVNGIKLVYTPSLNSKYFSQIFNSFFSFVHVCFSKI